MNAKSILACVFVVCGLLTYAFGQGRGHSQGLADGPQAQTKASEGQQDQSDVEVKNDRFSGATTITLKPQVLIDSPSHRLDMEMETKLGGKRQTGVSETDETVIITFTSLSNGGIDLGDEELHFLVDGKPIKGGESSGGTPSRVDDPKSKFKIRKRLVNSLSLVDVQRLAHGNRVEMRFGSIELTFDEKLMKRIRTFVAAAPSRYK
jgi:hypothetical protein